jgi:hypothetical protein
MEVVRQEEWESSQVARQKCCMPVCIRRVCDKASVEIRCAVSPPYGPTLPQQALCLIDRCASTALRFSIVSLPSGGDLPACIHKPLDQFLPPQRRKRGITHAPKATRYNEVTSVRSDWVFMWDWHGFTISGGHYSHRMPAQKPWGSLNRFSRFAHATGRP